MGQLTYDTAKAAIKTIHEKRDALLAERAELRKRRDEIATRELQIDRELADCQAAGRVFGVEIKIPKEEGDDKVRQSTYRFWRDAAARHTIIGSARAAREALEEPSAPSSTPELPLPAPQPMPRIRDIVLERLKAAGKAGFKAAPIRDYIESTYSTAIHEKTVGMTLYRLAKEGFVRRDGHTWFIVPETVNPGAATPGSDSPKR